MWDLYSGSLQQLLRPAESAVTSLQLVASVLGSQACLAATGHANGSCRFTDLSSGALAFQLPDILTRYKLQDGTQSAFMTVAQSRPLSVVGQHRSLQGWDLRFLRRELSPPPPGGCNVKSTQEVFDGCGMWLSNRQEQTG